jgi:acetyl esterase/lipase
MKQLFITILFILSLGSSAQNKEIIYLWPGKVPGELKEKQPPFRNTNRTDIISYAEITDPAFEVYLPESSVNKSTGIIVCPGGSYMHLSYDKEGTEIAAWLNKLGYAAFVLQYRVPNKKEGALQDAQRALRIIRNRASEWNLEVDKIGIMGFSAGGSLSARAATRFKDKTYSPVDKIDSLLCRPSFVLLIYPAFLDQGENRTLTPELKLSEETPPMFIFQTADDSFGNSSLVMTAALRNTKLPVELHMLPKGGHGYGMRPGNKAGETWPVLAEKWLESVLPPKK